MEHARKIPVLFYTFISIHFFFNLKNGECTRIGGSGLNKTTRKVKAKRICIRRGIPEDTG